MDIKDIKAIIDLMKKNELSLFEMEKEGFKIKLKKGGNGGYEAYGGHGPGPAVQYLPQAAAAPSAPAGAAAEPPKAADDSREITSPMVGTFYRSSAPDASPYIEVGQEVNEETTVCIIEAMKVLNEIKAETRGVITEVVAENGTPVQFAQVLFRVK